MSTYSSQGNSTNYNEIQLGFDQRPPARRPSKKIAQLKAGGPTFICTQGDRYYTVWYDFEQEVWYMNWGTDGMPPDNCERYATIGECEREMRAIADLRHWVYAH